MIHFYLYNLDDYKEAKLKLPIFCITSSTETEDVNVKHKRKHKKKKHFDEFSENEENITAVVHKKKTCIFQII